MAAAADRRYLSAAMSQPGLRTDLKAIVGEQGMLEGAAVRERGSALFHTHCHFPLRRTHTKAVRVIADLTSVPSPEPASLRLNRPGA